MTLLRKAFFLVALSCVPLTQAQTVVEATNLSFTTIDVPGAGVTAVQGINSNGEMVGVYGDTNLGAPHAFVLKGGSFTYLDYPGAYGTVAEGINDSDLVVGYAEFDGGLTAKGFTYNGTVFRWFVDGTDSGTFAMAINNSSDIVGGAGDIYGTVGFERKGVGFSKVSPPGIWIYAYATGINNTGIIVGWMTAGTVEKGFQFANGKTTTINVPAADTTEAHGINDSGLIVGWYGPQGTTSNYGFILAQGRYISFGYPGAMGTFPSAISSSGQITGSYTFDYITYHGFVTSPLPPALSDDTR